MYEHTIRVPLIFAGPNVPKGKVFAGHAYLRDIFPTVCELASVDVPEQVQGKSLMPVMQEERKSMYEFTVGYFRDSQRMIRTDRWKLIQYPLVKRTQLFDLSVDPNELRDVSDDPTQSDVRLRLEDQLEKWFAKNQRAD